MNLQVGTAMAGLQRSSLCALWVLSTPSTYTYSFVSFDTVANPANEASLVLGSFLPITLEQLARDRGFLLSDKKTRCSTTWDSQVFSVSMFSNSTFRIPESSQCIIYIFGLEINTASFAMYTFSASVLIQALLIISMSGAADHGSYRKSLLVTFAYIGAISTMFFIAATPSIYFLAAILAIVANTCFGASFVLLNSFLPLLVRHHPSMMKQQIKHLRNGNDLTDDNTVHNSQGHDVNSPLLGPSREINREPGDSSDAIDVDGKDLLSVPLRLSTKISSFGMGIGYIGSVILQVVCIIVVVATGQTTFSLRLVLFLIGLWWFLFTTPAILWLRPRPGPPLPFSESDKRNRSWLGYLAFSWKSLGKTIIRAGHLKDVIIFLVAWFLLSDGIATVSGTAVLFAKTQLDMKPAALGMISVIGTVFGVCGAFSWSWVSRKMDLQASHTIIACVCLFELIPLYGLLGFVPAVKRLGFLGLQQPWEMYPLSAVYGLVMGGLSSYCRSFFGELVPPGYETAFYALYAITDKGSSVFGPAIVGAITDRYGEIRPAFVFLAILILLPLPLMLVVDVERGKRDALALADVLEGRQPGHGYSALPPLQLMDGETEDDFNNR